MELENKILEIYNKEQKYVKDERVIDLLKVIVVDKLEDIDEIIEKANLTLQTIKKYANEKEKFIKFLTEEEYQMFKAKLDNILLQRRPVKEQKIIDLLRVVLIEKETNIDEIVEKANITLKAIKKYLDEKDIFLNFLTEEEFDAFKFQMEIIINKKQEGYKSERLYLVGQIIDEIENTRHTLDEACANNFYSIRSFMKLFLQEGYIDKNFGKGTLERVKQRITENGLIRERVPRNMKLIEDKFDILVANPDFYYLNEFDFRRLSFASSYLCSEANIDYVINKFKTDIVSTLAILSDPKLEPILKQEYVEELKRYIKIEKMLLNNNLFEKKEFLFSIIYYLENNEFDVNKATEYFKIPTYLFNKLLIESLKLPYFNKDIKQNIKSILNIEEKKVK